MLMPIANICDRRYSCRNIFALGFIYTMNISLSDTLKSFVDEQAHQQGLASSSDYVQALICKEQERLHLRGLLLEGAKSAQSVQVNKQYFDGLRHRVNEQAKSGT